MPRGGRAAVPAGERSSGPPLVSVALPLPIHTEFTYALKGPHPEPGTRVLVPFHRGERIGWFVGPAEGPRPRRVRSVLSILEDEPSASPDLLRLARWMADYYVAPLGVVLASILPSVLTDVSRDLVALTGPIPDGVTARAVRLARALEGEESPVRVSTLRKTLGMGSIWPEIRLLRTAGVLSHETLSPREPTVRTRRWVEIARELPNLVQRDEAFGRAHRQREAYEHLEAAGGGAELSSLTEQGGFSRSVVSGLEEKGLVVVEDREEIRDPFRHLPDDPGEVPPLTDAQAAVVAELTAAIGEPLPRPFLLHGITGSGKTRVYIELLKAVRARGQGAIVLVPEISLTPQTVKRFRAHFGDDVAVLHSGLSQGERYDAWRQLRAGEKTVAVGARSALFAPVRNLGAIVVDEEHDGSYKQSETPRYQARDLAVVRGAARDAVCLLGSATPSLESWSNASAGKFRLLELPDRIGGAVLPPVRTIDLREIRKGEREGAGAGRGRPAGGTILSPELVEAVNARLEREEQVILLLNRRGYASFVQCRECGDVRRCMHCAVSLTYHRTTGRVVCHHCRYEEAAPTRCERCGSDDLDFRGLGTEQVERVVTETFPGARIARMDVDTTSGKWAHQDILGRVERREVDILLGTQMISKGLDFPQVTLVGVVNADVGIHLPDFRATERTFQLLSQVAGRAGRGRLGGEVLIQTSLPDHYVLEAVKRHDYVGFAARELEERTTPAYPPHVRLANVVVSSPDGDVAADQAESAVHWVDGWLRRQRAPVERVGPAPAPIERLHARWRWHFLLRSESPRALGALCRDFMTGFQPRGQDVRVALDRDPVALL
ncbi:MAG TPA: primosomal protein N' [Longimicrobiales bacterium]|nr:primosomal protein N' [Longimicrobiales bacterium]